MFDSFNENRIESDTARFLGGGSGLNSSFGAVASYHGGYQTGFAMSGVDGGQGVILDSDDRGVFGPNGKPSLLPGDAGAQITRTNLSWATGLGQAATVTYAFRATGPGTMPSDTDGFSQFNSQQIAATLLALSAWSDVANITFNRVTDPGSQYSNGATILFGNYSSGSDGAAAFAFLPGSTAANASQGDVWVNSSLSYNQTPTLLQYGQQVLTHELGHAIGLSHPAAYNASANGVITYDADAIYFEDSRQYTIMSYFSEQVTGADFHTGPTNRYSSAPLMDDIVAAQRLYGANMTTRTGDTVYGFHSNAGQPWFVASGAFAQVIFCVWDAGGTDTLDFSGYATDNQHIDLRQGAFSSVGGLTGNVSIAMGAVIERAVGGSGLDNFIGNSADNRFSTGGGSGSVDGGLGTDTVVFTGNRADYTVTYNGRVATVTHNVGGTDQNIITNVEFLAFDDQTMTLTATGEIILSHGDATNDTINGAAAGDWLAGGAGNDVINGFAGQNSLIGGSGDDVLNGGGDVDFLLGGIGDDIMDGGLGVDTADYGTYDESGEGLLGAVGAVTVNLALGTATGGAGNDTLSHIENVTGTAWNDTLTGDGAANVLDGGGGIDTLNGGDGNDTLIAGTPGESGGAPDIVKAQGTANGAIATAVSLAGAYDLATRSDIANSSTIPHATVVATTHGGAEYYAVTVAAGKTVVFDIDNASFDSTLRLFDANGTELIKNDDSAGDGGNETDSGLSFTFATAGTYYIQVAEWDANQAGGEFTSIAPQAGGHYTLNVSVEGAPVVALTLTGSTLNGDAGLDTLTGGEGADTLNGGLGDDMLTGGNGADALNGGDGTDTAIYAGARSGYTFSTSGGVTTVTGPEGTDTLTNIEKVQFSDGLYGTDGNPLSGVHQIDGTPGADTLNGTAGVDSVDAGDGDDVINTLGGDDTIDGGLGTDTAIFSGLRSAYTVSTVGGTTTVTGPDGTDTLTNVERLQFSNATLIVGAGGGQYFAGTANADTITGTAFNDQIIGANGDDRITGAAGNDTIDGGQGADTAIFSGALAGYTVSTNPAGVTTVTGPDGTDTLTNVERLQFSNATLIVGAGGGQYFAGTAGADTVTGTAFNDLIESGAGDDTITGGAGADAIDGGLGTDTAVFATGASAYTATTTGGVTTVTGPDGTDTLTNVERLRFGAIEVAVGAVNGSILVGVNSAETLSGGALDDRLIGLGGADTLNGANGDDILFGNAGNDVLNGGQGSDTADYSAAAGGVTASLLAGTASNDGDGGADTLTGIENLTGSAFADGLTGDGLANVLAGRGGVDVLNGGGGFDTADYSNAAGAVTARLDNMRATNDGDGATDTFVGIEALTGSAFNDTLIGGTLGDTLKGGLGSDTLLGFGGDDVLWGGTGATNQLQGGLGDDTYVLEANDSVVETAGQGTDTVDARIATYILAANVETLIFGGTGNFTGTGNALNNTLTGGAGDDVLRGRGGVDVLVGGLGVDTADYSQATAGVQARLDVMRATNDGEGATDNFTSIEAIVGSAFNDTLVGGGLGDRLSGGLGADTILGFAGDDVLSGGQGLANQLQGGMGDDLYVLDTTDTIVELAGQGHDVIESHVGAYTMAANVEDMYYVGFNKFYGNGNAGNNVITGGIGNDILKGMGGNDTLIGGQGLDEVQFRGTKAQYTVTAEGTGYRVVDTVAGRDGSTLVESIETLRFLNGNTTTALTYPPAGPAPLEPEHKADSHALVSPLLPAGPDDAFLLARGAVDALVLPGLGDDHAAREIDGPQTLPGVDPAFGLSSIDLHHDAAGLGAGVISLWLEEKTYGGWDHFQG